MKENETNPDVEESSKMVGQKIDSTPGGRSSKTAGQSIPPVTTTGSGGGSPKNAGLKIPPGTITRS